MKVSNKVLILGGVIMDSYVVTKQYPERGQDTSITDFFDKVGGCSINVAVTLRNLGCEPYIVSGLGNDYRGHKINDYLASQGLNTQFISQEEGSTGYCLILLDDTGERTFLTYKGCEENLTDSISDESLIHDMSYVYVTGYYLLNSSYKNEKLRLLRILKESGSKIVFDPGSLVDEIEVDFLESVLRLSHIIVPNKTEVDKLIKRLNIESNFHEWCLDKNFEIVVIKNGSKEVNAYTKNAHYKMTPYKVQTVDTTGAGDSFAGGLIYSLMNNKSIQESMQIASACGAVTTTFLEPHGKFNIDDLLQIIRMGEESKLC